MAQTRRWPPSYFVGLTMPSAGEALPLPPRSWSGPSCSLLTAGARALRALAAAGAKFQAGDFATAEALLATADAGR